MAQMFAINDLDIPKVSLFPLRTSSQVVKPDTIVGGDDY